LKLSEVKQILNAEVICCEDKIDKIVVKAVAAADMMSEVLAYSHEHAVLLTGLTTPQALRTAQIMDLDAVIFVRGKRPPHETVELALKIGIPLLVTQDLLYAACGKLYSRGVPGC